MQVAVITLFPEMFRAITDSGISRRAVEQGLIELVFVNPREFTSDRHQTVDDRPYGGGPGMVMRVEPLIGALDAACERLQTKRENVRVIYLSPQGQVLTRDKVEYMQCAGDKLVLIAGRYEGIDERFIDAHVDEELSIGDYVLSGGELPAMVLLDSLIRRLPGALGDQSSAEQDSFEQGLLDCPHYTRPEESEGLRVPDVLLSGDHKRIKNWRLQQALGRTWERRPDLLQSRSLDSKEQQLLSAFIAERETQDKT